METFDGNEVQTPEQTWKIELQFQWSWLEVYVEIKSEFVCKLVEKVTTNKMLACARITTYQLNRGFYIIDNIWRVCPARQWTLAEWRGREVELGNWGRESHQRHILLAVLGLTDMVDCASHQKNIGNQFILIDCLQVDANNSCFPIEIWLSYSI